MTVGTGGAEKRLVAPTHAQATTLETNCGYFVADSFRGAVYSLGCRFGSEQVGQMPRILTETQIAEAIKKKTFLIGADSANADGLKYDFCIGQKFLKASFGQSVTFDSLSGAEKAAVQVDPGEVVFVLTQEQVALPGNMTALLSPKRSLAHQGILVLGGLSVDPNYKGALWVGLYNFSSTAFKLRPGLKLVAGMFYELAENEAIPTTPSKPVLEFPDDLILLIRNYKPIELKSVADLLQETRRELQSLKAQLTSDDDWKKDFKASLDEHNTQLGKLIDGLKEEREARKSEDEGIRSRLDQMRDVFANFRSGWVVAALIFAAILGWGIPALINAIGGQSQPQAPFVMPSPTVEPSEGLQSAPAKGGQRPTP